MRNESMFILETLYDKIEPVLTFVYAAEVWWLPNDKQTDKIHTFIIKRFLKVFLYSTNKMIYGENSRYAQFNRIAQHFEHKLVKCFRYKMK